MIRRLASLHWLQLGAVRQLLQYYQDAMTSCRSSRLPPLPSFGGTSVPLVRFAPRRTSAPPRPGVGHPVAPAGNLRGDDRISQSPVHNASFVTKCKGPPHGSMRRRASGISGLGSRFAGGQLGWRWQTRWQTRWRLHAIDKESFFHAMQIPIQYLR